MAGPAGAREWPPAPSLRRHRSAALPKRNLHQVDVTWGSWQRAFRCRGGSNPPPLAAHACRTRLSQEKVYCWEFHQTVDESIRASRCRQQQERRKAAGRVGPGGVVGGSSCYDRALGGLCSEAWDTQQFERVGFPLGEDVVHFVPTGVDHRWRSPGSKPSCLTQQPRVSIVRVNRALRLSTR